MTMTLKGLLWKSLFLFWILCAFSYAAKGGSRKGHKLTTTQTSKASLKNRQVDFLAPMENISIPLGKDAVFTCKIDRDVQPEQLQLVWLRLDSQTILAFKDRTVQNNPRIKISNEERREFSLHIENVQPEDSGVYVVQINTNPVSQMRAYLDVLVPPVILPSETTEHVSVREASNVTLKCAASGHPPPVITWTRDDNGYITPRGDEKALAYNGSELSLERVGRADMASYLCVASNGVPPAVSQRINVKVDFPPMVWVEPRHVGAWLGGSATLKCETEAHPQGVHFWFREGVVLTNNDKYDILFEPAPEPQAYRTKMSLHIKNINTKDFGDFVCSASNSHGSVEGVAKLYEIEIPPEARTTLTPKGKSTHRAGGKKKKQQKSVAPLEREGSPSGTSKEKVLYEKQGQMEQDQPMPVEEHVKGALRKKETGNSAPSDSKTSSFWSFLYALQVLLIFFLDRIEW